jgi:hypothetical protein
MYPSPFGANNMTDGQEAQSRKDGHTPAHKDFREKYFRGFRKQEDVVDINDQNAI